MSIQQITVPKTNPVGNGSASSKKLFDGSVVSQVNTIIHNAINMKASDIHLEPYEESFRLRYRLDGVLQEMGGLHPLFVRRFVRRTPMEM